MAAPTIAAALPPTTDHVTSGRPEDCGWSAAVVRCVLGGDSSDDGTIAGGAGTVDGAADGSDGAVDERVGAVEGRVGELEG